MPELSLEIGTAQIQNAIAVALAESFSPEKKDQLIRDVVRAHLSVKENNYDRETLLAKKVGAAIREAAMEEIKIILEGMKPRIAEITRKVLGPRFEASVFSQLETALTRINLTGITVSANYEVEE